MAASVLSVVSLRAQTADEIINKYIDALGGKEKLASIKTVYTEYDMEVMGQTASGSTWVVNGKGYKNVVDFAGQKIIQCFTDKGGWGVNPMMGQTTPEAMPAEQAQIGQSQMFVGGPLFNYAAKGSTVELIGKDTLNGKDAFKLKLKGQVGESLFWIDPTTYYVLKTTVKSNVGGTEMETNVAFSNYKKNDFGYVMPANTEINMAQGFTLNITTKKTEINKEIDMKLFEMPK
jgi:outer membrane lipoprotein-sorting protein